jgi:hypothetical protein
LAAGFSLTLLVLSASVGALFFIYVIIVIRNSKPLVRLFSISDLNVRHVNAPKLRKAHRCKSILPSLGPFDNLSST